MRDHVYYGLICGPTWYPACCHNVAICVSANDENVSITGHNITAHVRGYILLIDIMADKRRS